MRRSIQSSTKPIKSELQLKRLSHKSESQLLRTNPYMFSATRAKINLLFENGAKTKSKKKVDRMPNVLYFFERGILNKILCISHLKPPKNVRNMALSVSENSMRQYNNTALHDIIFIVRVTHQNHFLSAMFKSKIEAFTYVKDYLLKNEKMFSCDRADIKSFLRECSKNASGQNTFYGTENARKTGINPPGKPFLTTAMCFKEQP